MIKNIVFDMGGVLIRFDQKLFIQRLGVTGDDAELLRLTVFRSLEWALMDRGALDDTEAARILCTRLPERLHEPARKLVGMWDRPILPLPGMYELIEELKGLGYRIYLLSNASLRQPDYWPNIPASRFFDGALVSAFVKLVKPQPEIYRALCDKFSLKPEECYFVDDLPINIEGAHYIGMPGHVFNEDVPALRRDLIRMGVPVREA